MSRAVLLGRFSQLIIAISFLFSLAEALRNPARSIEVCDLAGDGLEFDSNTCDSRCKQNYVKSDPELKDENTKLYRALLKRAPDNRGPNQCCCIFNAPWPKFVQPELLNLHLWRKRMYLQKFGSCKPLVFGINLIQRTRTSYDLICRLLDKKKPMTILELLKFTEAAAYLNYMRPKHPAIRLTINSKEIKTIDKSVGEKLEKAASDHFFNSFKPLQKFDGYRLESDQLIEFWYLLKDYLKPATKSEVIAVTLDEYIGSYVIVDVAAAGEKLKEINQELGIPINLLAGEFDQYNEEGRAKAFSVPGLDCKSLAQVNNRLKQYLLNVKKVLDALFEKGNYEDMGRKYDTFIAILHSQRVYEDLVKYSCKSNSFKQG